MEFREFPKIARLFRPVVITEKIDGTNASIEIVPAVDVQVRDIHPSFVIATDPANGDVLLAGSRTRYVTPAADNMGWAEWVLQNAPALWMLGPGQHFGEWWGQGIQRKYGLTEKRFSLFNVGRWQDAHGTNKYGTELIPAPPEGKEPAVAPACCYVVPIIAVMPKFGTDGINSCLCELRANGSKAAPGFMSPEGIVAYHAASKTLFKATCQNDDEPKGKLGA